MENVSEPKATNKYQNVSVEDLNGELTALREMYKNSLRTPHNNLSSQIFDEMELIRGELNDRDLLKFAGEFCYDNKIKTLADLEHYLDGREKDYRQLVHALKTGLIEIPESTSEWYVTKPLLRIGHLLREYLGVLQGILTNEITEPEPPF